MPQIIQALAADNGTLIRAVRNISGEAPRTMYGIVAELTRLGGATDRGIFWIHEIDQHHPPGFEARLDKPAVAISDRARVRFYPKDIDLYPSLLNFIEHSVPGLAILHDASVFIGRELRPEHELGKPVVCKLDGEAQTIDLDHPPQDSPFAVISNWFLEDDPAS
jgi:hypothetical protein